MPFKFNVLPVYHKCPKCKGRYRRKPHTCYPAKDKEVLPQNRPELHYRDDIRAALSPQSEIRHEPPAASSGTIDILLPEIEPERKERPVKIRKGKSGQKDREQILARPETETRYESPKDIRDMDHTKDYAHAYQEEGRLFGSHPSHDGFDDESNP